MSADPSYTPNPADLDGARRHLVQCGPCDYGLVNMGCNCPDGDPRPVIQRLVAEIEGWRALATEGRPAGSTVEWGWTGYDDKDPQRGIPLRDEEAARSVVALHPGTQLVRRAVGPWLPAPDTDTDTDKITEETPWLSSPTASAGPSPSPARPAASRSR